MSRKLMEIRSNAFAAPCRSQRFAVLAVVHAIAHDSNLNSKLSAKETTEL